MKVVAGSSRGSGGRGGGLRGRGRGRGGGEDRRFSARHSDPRFAVSTSRGGGGRGGRGGFHRSNAQDAISQDPRFAQRLAAKYDTPIDDDEQEDVDSGSDDEPDDASSAHESPVEEEEAVPLDENEEQLLDEDAANWSGSDIEFCEARSRVAIVNCDWDHVRAVDIFAILFHSLPLGGQLKDVKVYLSEFGKKMIDFEKQRGPDLWVKPGEEDIPLPKEIDVEELPEDGEPPFDGADDIDEDAEDGWVEDDPAMLDEVGEDGEKFSSGKYRKYERDRMKYYYAVATFDSPDTAAAVYNELDGMDIEASGVTLDLRYIDDDETFDEKPVQSCTRLPPNFKPLAAFKAAALTQTQFRISWDQDDPVRFQSIRDAFTGATEEDDLAAYIAEDSSDEDLENDPTAELKKKRREEKRRRIRAKYAALLEDIGGIPEATPSDESEGDSSASQSDDNDLNHFSDVEDGSEDVVGDMEATLDFDVGNKAQLAQRQAQLAKQFKEGDIGSRAQLKHKLKRKENKLAKKESLSEMRASERAAIEADKLSAKVSLKKSLGDLIEDGERANLSGKQKRKEHAKKTKQRIALEKADKKKQRLADSLGLSAAQVESRKSKGKGDATSDASTGIDSRFASKLLSDPRFHLDVAQKDKKRNPEVMKLASTVVKARQQQQPSASAGESKKTSRVEADDIADYFIGRNNKKSRKE